MGIRINASILCLLFTVILSPSAHAGMSKDSNHIYCNKVPLSGPDPNTFVILSDNGNYGKDATKVYSCFVHNYGQSTDFSIPDADVNSFVALDESYAKDKDHAYYGNSVVLGADPRSFEVLEYPKSVGNIAKFFSRDSNHLFYGSAEIKDADRETFRVISGMFSLDKNHVYKNSSILQNADPKSFEFIDGTYQKDENTVFYLGIPIPGADSATFKVTNGFFGTASDKNHTYSRQAGSGHIESDGKVFIPDFKNGTMTSQPLGVNAPTDVVATSDTYACNEKLGLQFKNNQLSLITIDDKKRRNWALIGKVENKDIVPLWGRSYSTSEINNVNFGIKTCKNVDGNTLVNIVNEFNPKLKRP